MPDTGSGTGTAIIPALCPAEPPWTTDDLPACQAVSLARYVEIIGVDECGFWGVNYDGQPSVCKTIWIKKERDMIQRYLVEAQQEIESVTNYPLVPCWIEDERALYRFPLLAAKTKIHSGGVVAMSYIDDDAVVDYATDPAIVGPIATTITDPDEVRVYFAASLTTEMREIAPSRIVLTGGLLTIYIPRCRLVHPDYWENPRTGWDYADDTYFCDVVDVMRVYNDPSEHATMIWPHQCDGCSGCTCPTCSEYTQTACIYVHDGEIGQLGVLPAEYSGGSWSRVTSCRCANPSYVLLNYRAGGPLTYELEDAVVRLAHSKMPQSPCACEWTSHIWENDRNVPEAYTAQRANNPFGLSDGAWRAYVVAVNRKIRRGSMVSTGYL